MHDRPTSPIKNQFFPCVLWKNSFFEKPFRLIKKLPLVQFTFGSFESCPLPWAIDIGGGLTYFKILLARSSSETTSKTLEMCTFLKDYNGFVDNPIFVVKTGFQPLSSKILTYSKYPCNSI